MTKKEIREKFIKLLKESNERLWDKGDEVSIKDLSEYQADYLMSNNASFEENFVELRKNYAAAEDFICSLCGNCTVTEHENGLVTHTRHCCESVGYPVCGKFVAKDNNVPRKKVITKIFSVQSVGDDVPMLFSWKIQDRIEEVAQETGAYDFRVISVFRDHLDGQSQYTAFVQCQLPL